jgi:hypothetical protein
MPGRRSLVRRRLPGGQAAQQREAHLAPEHPDRVPAGEEPRAGEAHTAAGRLETGRPEREVQERRPGARHQGDESDCAQGRDREADGGDAGGP